MGKPVFDLKVTMDNIVIAKLQTGKEEQVEDTLKKVKLKFGEK